MLHTNRKAIEALSAYLRYKYPDTYSPPNYGVSVELSIQDATTALEMVDRVLPE